MAFRELVVISLLCSFLSLLRFLCLGGGIARRLVAGGKSVHLVGRNKERVAALANELNSSFSVCDVTVAGEIERATREAGDDVDGLAYCVGTIVLKKINSVSLEGLLNDFVLHAGCAALAVQSSLPLLKKSNNGSVLFFSTVAAQIGMQVKWSELKILNFVLFLIGAYFCCNG
jgi:NADP-dependent 3-hydroxy acid dehydrogenase YdfG